MTTSNTFTTTLRIEITKLRPTAPAVPKKGKATPKTWPKGKVADVELQFTEGLLNGHKLRGFSIWRRDDGQMWVTGPNRQYGTGEDTKYYDFLPAPQPRREFFHDFIIAEYNAFIADRTERGYPAGEVDDEEDAA